VPSMPANLNKDARWTAQANIERYLRILNSPLTDLERQYVERRLTEERNAVQRVASEQHPARLEPRGPREMVR